MAGTSKGRKSSAKGAKAKSSTRTSSRSAKRRSPKEAPPDPELLEFERLKPRLQEMWNSLTLREEEPHTSVVVPSLTLDQIEMTLL